MFFLGVGVGSPAYRRAISAPPAAAPVFTSYSIMQPYSSEIIGGDVLEAIYSISNSAGSSTTVAFQWLVNDVAVPGATSKTFNTAAYEGLVRKFKCRISATNASGTTVVTTSEVISTKGFRVLNEGEVVLNNGGRVYNAVSGLSLGIHITDEQIDNWSDAEMDAAFAEIKELGIVEVRGAINFEWVMFGATKGPTRYWTNPDRFVNKAIAAGLNVLLVLLGVPTWARNGWNSTGLLPPADVLEYRDWCVETVNRYYPLGVVHYQIGNEPNLRGSWRAAAPPNDGPSASSYMALLSPTYDGIKAAQPNAIVIAAGLSMAPLPADTATPKNYIPAETYLTDLYANGFKTKADVVAFHPYARPHRPSETQGWNGWRIMAQDLRAIMNTQTDLRPVMITEFGAPTSASPSGLFVSEAQQALDIKEAYDLASSYFWVTGPFCIYQYRDRGADSGNPEHRYGIEAQNGTPKPATDMVNAISPPFN